MTELEDSLREALIQEEAFLVSDADIMVPHLVAIARSTRKLLQVHDGNTTSATLIKEERDELNALRRQVQAANIDISSLRENIQTVSILHTDARRILNRVGVTLGCADGAEPHQIVAAAERSKKNLNAELEEQRQRVSDLEIQLLDAQRQHARVADTLNEITWAVEKAKLKEEGKSS